MMASVSLIGKTKKSDAIIVEIPQQITNMANKKISNWKSGFNHLLFHLVNIKPLPFLDPIADLFYNLVNWSLQVMENRISSNLNHTSV